MLPPNREPVSQLIGGPKILGQVSLFIGDLGLLGPKNLLVEGTNDQLILSHLGRETGELSDWKILPCNDPKVCVFIVGICQRIGREVAVLVDGDSGGNGYLSALNRALKNEDISDIRIHTLHEFCLRPIDDTPFCIEDFLSQTQYVAAVNDAYEMFSWYLPISEAEITALASTTPIANRLEELFNKRTWKDNKPHKFDKSFVSIHLASSRRKFDVQTFDGDLRAMWLRLSNRYNLIRLGNASFPGKAHPSSALFSLAFPLKKGGVKRIAVHADGTAASMGERVFPTENVPLVTKNASEPQFPSASDQTSPQNLAEHPEATAAAEQAIKDNQGSGSTEDTKEHPESARGLEEMASTMGKTDEKKLSVTTTKPLSLTRTKTVIVEKVKSRGPAATTKTSTGVDDPPIEEPPKDAISVFDCWQRKWTPNTAKSFLTDGAGIIQINGYEAFERANVTFKVTYCDSTTRIFTWPKKRLEKGDIVTGIVTGISGDRPLGFRVKIDGRKTEGFVHISQITGSNVRDVSDHVTEGQRVAATYLGFAYDADQFSMIGVKQPQE